MTALNEDIYRMIIDLALWYPILPCDSLNPMHSLLILSGALAAVPSVYQLREIDETIQNVCTTWKKISLKVHRRQPITSWFHYVRKRVGSGISIRTKWGDDDRTNTTIPSSVTHLSVERKGSIDGAEPFILDLPALGVLSLTLAHTAPAYPTFPYADWVLPSLQTLGIVLDGDHVDDVRHILESLGGGIATLSIHLAKKGYTKRVRKSDRDLIPLPDTIWQWLPRLRRLRVSLWHFRLLEPPPTGFPPIDIYFSDFDEPWNLHSLGAPEVEPWSVHLAKWANHVNLYRLGVEWKMHYNYTFAVCRLGEVLYAFEENGYSVCDASRVPWNNEEIQTIFKKKEEEYLASEAEDTTDSETERNPTTE